MTEAPHADQSDVDWRALNRANWDDRVPVHLASSFYDVEGFADRWTAGAGSLPAYQLDEVGDVTGKRLVHLQCHIGLDTLSWARRGAQVSGLDFSAPAISAAESLASRLGVAASFVVSDVYDAFSAFNGGLFDVVYTGTGALCWLPSVERWASVAASLLAPGGFLYLAESHPFTQMLSDDGGTIGHDYFDSSPQLSDYEYTYTDGPPLTQTRQVEFRHGMGSIVTALATAGLRVDFLHENDFETFQRFDCLVRDAGGQYRFPPGRPRVPMTYSLRATKPTA